MHGQIRAKCLWPLVFGLLAGAGLNAASSAVSVFPGLSQRLELGPGDKADVQASNPSNQNQILVVSRQAVDVRVNLHTEPSSHLSHPVLGYSSDYVFIAPQSVAELSLNVVDTLSPPGTVDLSVTPTGGDDLILRSSIALLQQASQDYRQGTRESMRSAFRTYASVAVMVQNSKNTLLAEITAQANHAAGEIAFALQDADNTVKHLETAALRFQTLGKEEIAAVALSSLGQWHLQQGHHDKAIDAFSRALETIGGRDPIIVNRIEFNRCLVQLELLELAAAEQCFAQSAAGAERLRDTAIEIASNEARAGVYSSRGQHNRALKLLLSELNRWQASDNAAREAVAHNNVAIQYRRLGDMQDALNHYQQALSLFVASGNERAQVTALRNIARAYFLSGNYERAEEFAAESLNKAQLSGNKRAQARSLFRIAEIRRATGRIDEASRNYDTAEELAREFNDEKMLFDILSARARLNLSNAEANKALKQLEKARALRDSFEGSPVDFGNLALARARAYFQLGDRQATQRALKDSFSAMQEASYPLGIALAHELAGSIALENDQWEQAKTHANEAIKIFDAIRGSLASLDLRANFGINQVDAYAILVDASMQQARQHPDSNYAAEAFRFATQSRAKTLSEVLAQSDGGAQVPEKLIQQRNELVQQISQYRDADSPDSSGNSLSRKLIALDAIDAELEKYNPRLAGLGGKLDVSVDRVQALLRPEQLLLQYYLGNHKAYLFVLSRDSFAAHELGQSDTIDRLAREFTQRLRNILPLRNAGKALAQRILGPASTDLKQFSELLVVADGALHYVPFEALVSPGQNDYVIKSHLTSYLPSAVSLSYFRNVGPEARPGILKVSVFADPVFESNDPRINAITNQPETTTNSRGARSSANYNRLSLSELEAQSIQSRLPNERTLLHTGVHASRQAFLATAEQPSNILHLATHGIVDPDRPELTGLMFSRFDSKANASNGFVGMRDIYSLPLDVDLVVLSACDTALGREIPGEGLLGLTRGFLYAGADRVIASLWPVLDRATAALMEHFYAERIENGRTSAQALRSAKLAVQSESRWRHPYYWSGIVLQGI